MREASVCVIQNSKGETLFLERTDKPFGWCLPGGKKEDGETDLEACLREVEEETGITLTSAVYVGDSVSVNGRVIHVFFAEIDEDDALVILSHEHSDFIWADSVKEEILAGNTLDFINLAKYAKDIIG